MKDIGTVDKPQKFVGEELQVDVFDGADPTDVGTRRWWYRDDLSVNGSDAVIRVNNNGEIVDVPIYENSTSVEAGIDTRFGVVAPGLSEPAFVPLTDPADAAFDFGRIETPSGTELSLHNRTAPGSAIPDSGVSRWTFDNDDLSGSDPLDVWGANDGVNNGATTGATGIAGYDSGEAFSFDATDDYIDAGGDSSLKGTPFSFTFWTNLDDASADSRFGGTFSSDNTGWLARYEGPNSQWKFEWGDGGAFNSLTGPSQSAGVGVFIAVTVGGGTVDVYRNDASNIISGSVNISNGTNNFYIGRDPAFGQTVAGDMDDPRYFSKKLSSTEVSNLYNTGSI